MRKYLAIALLGLTACATAPLTNQVAAAGVVLEDTVNQINHLQKIGQISTEQESALLDKAEYANAQLRLAKSLAINCKPDCTEAKSRLESVNALLLQLQAETK